MRFLPTFRILSRQHCCSVYAQGIRDRTRRRKTLITVLHAWYTAKIWTEPNVNVWFGGPRILLHVPGPIWLRELLSTLLKNCRREFRINDSILFIFLKWQPCFEPGSLAQGICVLTLHHTFPDLSRVSGLVWYSAHKIGLDWIFFVEMGPIIPFWLVRNFVPS